MTDEYARFKQSFKACERCHGSGLTLRPSSYAHASYSRDEVCSCVLEPLKFLLERLEALEPSRLYLFRQNTHIAEQTPDGRWVCRKCEQLLSRQEIAGHVVQFPTVQKVPGWASLCCMAGVVRRNAKPVAGGGAIMLIIISFIEWVTGSGILGWF